MEIEEAYRGFNEAMQIQKELKSRFFITSDVTTSSTTTSSGSATIPTIANSLTTVVSEAVTSALVDGSQQEVPFVQGLIDLSNFYDPLL